MNHRLARVYRRRWMTLILGVLIVLFFVLLQKGLLRGVDNIFGAIARPIWQAENFTADFLALTVSSKKDLYKQNIALKAALAEKEHTLAGTDVVREENEDLKNILGRVNKDSTIVLSAILAKPNQTPYDTLIIDRGEDDGLVPDDLVFAQGNILVGEIESVEAKTAKVILFSTPGNISQVVLGATGKYFNARGQGGGTIEVEVSREVEVKEGDMFFYPGLDNTLVGVAKKIEFDPRDSFKRVIMKSPVNIQEERWVEVRI